MIDENSYFYCLITAAETGEQILRGWKFFQLKRMESGALSSCSHE